MHKVSAVIDSNWGDSGKGLVTDYLASQGHSVVVRFNGGSQAGHTVCTPFCTPYGKRHVFHHFSSGTFAHAETFLSKYFVCNPMFFIKEWHDLHNLGFNPSVFVDPLSLVTTPWDIMLNQAAELKRGNSRHGSCGMGFNETIERNQNGFILMYQDLLNHDLVEKLGAIRESYVPRRSKELGITLDINQVMNSRIFDHYLDDVDFMKREARAGAWEDYGWNESDQVIFEGAQGLGLDMDNREDFPYLTRSRTGLANVMSLIKDHKLDDVDLDVYYVTRTYATRHGNGPLKHEEPLSSFYTVQDETNTYNEHQGQLRFGILDLNDLVSRITKDLADNQAYGIQTNPIPVVTCADQCSRVEYFWNGNRQVSHPEVFTKILMEMLAAKEGLISFGKTRKTVRRIGV